MKIEKSLFGYIPDKTKVYLYTIETDSGLKAKVTNYGGILTSLFVPDKNGNFDDIVLGFDNLEQYLGDHPFFGAIIGRYGNRIGGAKFIINGEEYQLTQNENGNILHGGTEKPFHKVLWNAEEIKKTDEIGLKFSYLSPDGEEGFPGNLNVEVIYKFTNNNEFKISYAANTDKATHVNLTHHSYFNLTGCKESISNHQISIHSRHITEVDDKLIPTGKFIEISNSPLDLQSFRTIGDHIKLLDTKGFDHNYVLDKYDGNVNLASKVVESSTGRMMEVYTNEPGLQFYSGNFIGKMKGKNGIDYADFYGLALESQHYPDSPNKPEFPSTLLNPGETYKSETVYKFLTIN